MKRIVYPFLGILGATFAIACIASDANYPTTWAAPIAVGECPDISGFYEYYGESSVPLVGAAYTELDRVVFSTGPSKIVPSGVRIFHDRDKNLLEYELIGKGESLNQRQTFERVFECKDGWVTWINSGKGYSADSPVIEWETVTKLTKAKDGSLILSYQGKTKNLFLIFFKYTKSKSGWFRYLPAKEK